MLLSSIITKAGCIPLLPNNKFVLVSNVKDKFVFPKGKIEDAETAQIAAAREAEEEAGVVGTIDKQICELDGTKWYMMNVIHLKSMYKECDIRKRVIVSYDEALKLELSRHARKLLKKLRNERLYL
ncbi:hypothetical protein COBT_002158 [Conglomerata obtusa]